MEDKPAQPRRDIHSMHPVPAIQLLDSAVIIPFLRERYSKHAICNAALLFYETCSLHVVNPVFLQDST